MEALNHLLSEELIYALGWTVIHSLWQGALIAFLIGILMVSLQNKPARLRYVVANSSLAAVLLLAVATFFTTYHYALERSEQEVLIAAFSGNSAADSLPVWDNLVAQFRSYFNENLPLIVSIWMLGLTFFLLRLLGGLTYVQYLKNRYTQPLPEYWQVKLRDLATRIPVKKTVKLMESALVSVPMVIGYFKPVILLPVGALNQLNTEQVEAILAHELAHIYRSDFAFNILQSVVEALFYFNPAVWWISANIRTERENCCDDIAVRICGNNLTYAKALVSLQEMNFRAPAMAMPFGKNKNQLLLRIKRILNQPHNKSNIMEKITATSMLLLALLLLSFGANGSLSNALSIDDQEMIDKYTPTEITFEKYSYHNDIWTDSIPAKSGKSKRQKFIKREDGKTIEMILENDKVVALTIDGEEIPKDEIEDHKALTDQLREEMNAPINLPPAPPAPPGMPVAPIPPTPPSPATKPIPPMPPGIPVPPAPPAIHKMRTIKAEKDDKGNTFIFIESTDGDEPIEIKVQRADGHIVINAEELPSDADGIIIKELDADGRMVWFEAFPSADDVSAFYWMDEASVQKYGEDYLEKLAELELAMSEYGQITDEEQKKALELAHRELQKADGQMERDRSKMQLELERTQRLSDKEAKKLAEEVQRIREIEIARGSNAVSPMRRMYGSGSQHRIEQELLKDGLIQNTKNYEFELTSKKLEVNDKKQSKALHEKYIRLYEELYGKKFGEDSKIQIDKEGEER